MVNSNLLPQKMHLRMVLADICKYKTLQPDVSYFPFFVWLPCPGGGADL